MRLIVIFGDEKENAIGSLLKSTLDASGKNYLYLKNGHLYHLGQEEKIIEFGIVECSVLDSFLSGHKPDIFVFKENFSLENLKLSPYREILKGSRLVFSSDNQMIPDFLKNIDLIPISCGMSSKNTVTISSNLDDNVTVFLQRNLKALSGEIVGVEEILIKNSKNISPYNIMAGTVTALLCGAENKQIEK